jgi:hypothetical protein
MNHLLKKGIIRLEKIAAFVNKENEVDCISSLSLSVFGRL